MVCDIFPTSFVQDCGSILNLVISLSLHVLRKILQFVELLFLKMYFGHAKLPPQGISENENFHVYRRCLFNVFD